MVGNEEQSTVTDQFAHLVEELKRERDEINLSIHLAKAEIRDEWEDLEKKWVHIKSKSEQVGKEVKLTSQEVGETVKQLVDDLRKGYKRLRKVL